MLIKDESCIADKTIMKYQQNGIIELLGSGWCGIMVLSPKSSVYIESRHDVKGIGDDYAIKFVQSHIADLSKQDFDYKTFYYDGANFVIFPIRKTDKNYLVFFLHCRLDGPFLEKDLQWYKLYASVAYQRLLLDNELVQEKNYIKNVLGSTESAIAVFDTEYRVLSSNSSADELFSSGLEQSKNVLGNDNKIVLMQAINEVVATNTKKQLYNMIVTDYGSSRILNITLSPLLTSKDKVCGVVVVASDNTQKQVNDYMFEQRKYFNQIGEISLGLSCDIRVPLMNIQGCASLLKHSNNLEASDIDLLDCIVNEISNIDDILQQMLSFENLTKCNTYKMVSINEILENCICIVNRQKVLRKIDIYCELAEELPLVRASNVDIHQVFLNIMINALQAIKEQGVIKVISQFDYEHKIINVYISDNGVGISEGNKSKLFYPYFTTKPNGTGMGLFLAKQVIKQYGGEISIKSHQSVGTTCHISLPCNYLV